MRSVDTDDDLVDQRPSRKRVILFAVSMLPKFESWQEGLSLRPCNVPSMFLCHHGFRVNIQTSEENLVWKQHATWRQMPGLSDEKKGVSFQSVSHPNRYIRIRSNGEAWLDTFEDTPQFRQEATFYFRPPQFQFWPE